MANHEENNGVPPFYNTPTHPRPPVRDQTKYRAISQITMFVGWASLTIAMVGGAKLLWDILTDGLEAGGLIAKIISLGLAFLLGWIVSLVCIRSLGNLVLPLVINVYIFLTASGILVMYARVALKLFDEVFYADPHYARYSLGLLAGFAILVGLHLLIEDHDLRPFSIPFLIGGVIHLFGMVTHYVFMEGKPEFIMGDMYFFVVLMIIATLMLAHLGIFNLARRIIDGFFVRNSDAPQPGNRANR